MFQEKLVYVFLALILLNSEVNGKPQWLEATAAAGIMVGTAISNSQKCSEFAGCHRGNCWSWCGLDLSGGEWCYITRTYSQSFQYVPCLRDSDCDKCWKCASSCTV